jgi:hypothetical protein
MGTRLTLAGLVAGLAVGTLVVRHSAWPRPTEPREQPAPTVQNGPIGPAPAEVQAPNTGSGPSQQVIPEPENNGAQSVIVSGIRRFVNTGERVLLYEYVPGAGTVFLGRLSEAGEGLALIGVADDVAVVAVAPYSESAMAPDALEALATYDISDPGEPTRLATFDLPDGVTDLSLAADTVYVAFENANGGGLWAVDVSNPAAPESVGTFTATSPRLIAVEAATGYLVGLDATSQWYLMTVDLQQPNQIQTLGTLNLAEPVTQLQIRGDHAFLADSGLTVVDVSQPSAPSQVAHRSFGTAPSALSIGEDVAYVSLVQVSELTRSTTGSTVVLVDVSEPKVLDTDLGTLDIADAVRDTAVVEQRLCVAADQGLREYDASAPENIVQVSGPQQTRNWWQAVAVAGSHAYVLDRYAGLVVLDASNPAQIAKVGTLPMAIEPESAAVRVAPPYAYIASGTNVRVVNIASPTTPVLAGSLDLQAHSQRFIGISDVVLANGMLFVAGGEAGTFLVNVANPANPTVVGSVAAHYGSVGLGIQGATLFVGDHNGTMYAFDVSNPATPVALGSIGSPGGIRGLRVANGQAVLVGNYGHIVVVNVSNPLNPQIVGSLAVPADAWRSVSNLALGNGVAYVSTYDNGVRVVALANAGAPQEVGVINGTGYALAGDVSGNRVYLVIGDGLSVVDVANPAAPTDLGLLASAG